MPRNRLLVIVISLFCRCTDFRLFMHITVLLYIFSLVECLQCKIWVSAISTVCREALHQDYSVECS
jgi:hypothetical protein